MGRTTKSKSHYTDIIEGLKKLKKLKVMYARTLTDNKIQETYI